MAREDRDEDVRSDAVQSLLSLVDTYDILLEADKALLSKISMAITTDPEQQVWSKWIRLFTTMAQKSVWFLPGFLLLLIMIIRSYGFITNNIKMAREDADKDVRVEAVQSLITLVMSWKLTNRDNLLIPMPNMTIFLEKIQALLSNITVAVPTDPEHVRSKKE
ncbi:hypothetical protein BDQ17DRAFT_1426008 [Cyathus striatus]|nr:hypothetical protein BDQ17DRAFT_1426008 [Cyathus striatus]